MEASLSKKIDVDNCIVWGDALRVLLNSDQISPGEIKTILKEKGVFIDSLEKSITVPLLSYTLLTPSEFERLISNSYARESNLKSNSESLTLVSDASDWRAELMGILPDIKDSIVLDQGYSFLNEPHIIANDDGTLEIAYKVQREDASLDWIAQTREYEGSITFRQKNGSVVVEALKAFTAKETDRINSLTTRLLAKKLKSKGIIKEDEPKGVFFNDFDNEQRVKFMLFFTGASARGFSFNELIDVDIVRDETSGPLPDDPEISWMENKVRKLRVNGENLHEINLVTNKIFHKFCFLTRMSAKYNYQFGADQGECLVTFWFGRKNKYDSDFTNAEFSVSVDTVGRYAKGPEAEIRRKIYRKIEDLKNSAIQKIKPLVAAAILRKQSDE